MLDTESPEPEDDVDAILRLQDRQVSLRYGKSGRVLIVDASASQLRADDITVLVGLPRLKELILGGCEVNDRIAEVLPHLQRLQVLDLRNTAVTDGVLEEIAKLPLLKLLDVSGTQVTLESVRQLRKRMIKTRIVYLG